MDYIVFTDSGNFVVDEVEADHFAAVGFDVARITDVDIDFIINSEKDEDED